MIAKAVVNSAPPPIPCRARKTISWTMPLMPSTLPNSPDRPDSHEPARKMAMPDSSTGLRP